MGGAGRGERQKGRRRRLSFYGFSSSFLLLFRDRFDLNSPSSFLFLPPYLLLSTNSRNCDFFARPRAPPRKKSDSLHGRGGKLQHLPGPKQCRVISGFSSPLPPSSFRGPNSPCLQIIN